MIDIDNLLLYIELIILQVVNYSIKVNTYPINFKNIFLNVLK